MSDKTIDKPGLVTTVAETAAAPVAATDERQPARGTSVGRYLVLERIGAGGMGVVYAAYDPTLDRRVALKLLHPKNETRAGGYQLRLLREAQAMAKLSHPNVVAVHDVELVDDRVVLAMEYVRGVSLDEWLAESRPWREVLDMFVAAGAGLAAAHAGGIVHRDFKPSNVLVGPDGRARVTDFGLARPEGDADVSSADASESPALQTPMTQTGAVMGTPAYMAPEQHLGEQADARADQFSFCVSLYEGLYGQRPFAGTSAAQLVSAIERYDVRAAPKACNVPRWLRDVLLRGLRADRNERHVSMAALLAELTRDRSSRVGKAVAFVAGVVVLVVSVNIATRPSSANTPDVCAAAAGGMNQVWGQRQSALVHDSFRSTKVSYAGEVAALVVPRIHDYTTRWRTMRMQSCHATRVDGRQSETMMDRKMMCLDERLQSVVALVSTLTTKPDKKVIDTAAALTANLPNLDDCEDKKSLLAAVSPPTDPTVRSKILEADRESADINNLTTLNKFASALTRAEQLVKEVELLPYAPTRAKALYERGVVLSRLLKPSSEASLNAALKEATSARMPKMVMRIWFALVELIGVELKQPKRALTLLPYAEAAVAASSHPAEYQGMLLGHAGAIRLAAGDLKGAERDLKESVAVLDNAEHVDRYYATPALSNLAELYLRLHKLDDAARVIKRFVALAQARQGKTHIQVALAFNALAILHVQRQAHDRARETFLRSLAIKRAVLSPDHVSLLETRWNLASLDNETGNAKRALPEVQAMLKIYERLRGPKHIDVSDSLAFLADVHVNLAQHAKAKPLLLRALRISDKVRGKDHPQTAHQLRRLGSVYEHTGDSKRCLQTYARARAAFVAKLGKKFWAVGTVSSGIGHCYLNLKRYDKAVTELERAVAIYAKYDSTLPWQLGDAQLWLGQALWLANRNHKRARTLLDSARKNFVKDKETRRVKELDAWLNDNIRSEAVPNR